MLGDGVSMVIASIWASMANWSTPTVLFCVLNLMIATIFIASNFNSPNHHQNNPNTNPSQLARSPSLLDRVKSVNLSSFYTTTPESHDHQYGGHSETTESNPASQLSHPTSLLQRVKSIDFSFASFHNSFTTDPSERVNPTNELTRAPSLLDRVKSFKLTSPFTSDHHSDDSFPNMDEHSDSDHPHQDLTDLSETSGGTDPARNLVKSRSDRVVASDGGDEHVDQRRSASMKSAVGVHDECVDTKAEDFIKRFKQQLKLQRIDSLQRLKEMMNRGTSSD